MINKYFSKPQMEENLFNLIKITTNKLLRNEISEAVLVISGMGQGCLLSSFRLSVICRLSPETVHPQKLEINKI